MKRRNVDILIVLLLVIVVAIYGAVRYQNSKYILYVQDPVNTCEWRDGVIVLGTKVANLNNNYPKKHVLKSNEQAFLKEVAKVNQCWYRKS